MGEKKDLEVLKHELVPKMEILSDSQKQKLFENYSIRENQLPKIKSTDPAVIALGAKAGEIIKIARRDPTGKYYYYRIVV